MRGHAAGRVRTGRGGGSREHEKGGRGDDGGMGDGRWACEDVKHLSLSLRACESPSLAAEAERGPAAAVRTAQYSSAQSPQLPSSEQRVKRWACRSTLGMHACVSLLLSSRRLTAPPCCCCFYCAPVLLY